MVSNKHPERRFAKFKMAMVNEAGFRQSSCDDNGEIRFWLVGQNAPSRVSRERLKTFSDLLFFFLMSCETA